MIRDSFIKVGRETKSPFITNPYRFGGGGIGGWTELARTTLGSAGDIIDVTSFADKRYYMILSDLQPSGVIGGRVRYGTTSIDTGSNYARRQSADGGSDGTGINLNQLDIAGLDADDDIFRMEYIANLSGKEKLGITHVVGRTAVGAGTAPLRREGVTKWANTSNPMQSYRAYNAGTGNYASGSEVVVLGWDPADTHTSNFWEELASVELGSAGNLSSGTITAKKYLWVQIYSTTGTSANDYLRFNSDSGTNYSDRKSADGSTDATRTGQTALINHINEGGRTTPSFTNLFIINNSANEKLVTGHVIQQLTAGAGNAPSRLEVVGKWANTSSQITNITAFGTLGIGSFIKVWGSN